jgi:poly-beta-1,6-N-acetyl-D-glucosamine synthase
MIAFHPHRSRDCGYESHLPADPCYESHLPADPSFEGGLVGTPFYLLTAVLAPAFELLGLVALGGAIALGPFQPLTFVVMVAAFAFVNASLAASAVYFEDMQSRSYRKRDLLVLLLYTPLDFVLYRPIILWSRLKGSLGFLRGDKAWHKFERNVRAPA